MRIAIISDLHANEWAWQAVRTDLASMGAQRIVCLGDVVGYGPRPAEVLESVYEQADHILLGNHDAALAGLMPDEAFNEDARAVLRWSRERLSSSAAARISEWPLVAKGPGFRAAHAEFSAPGCFHYIFEPEEAGPSWQKVSEPLLFVGHTHLPSLYILGSSGIPRAAPAQDFVVEPGRRYIVNPGSVGQPRDGDPRASYALYDTEARAIYFRRVPFDLDAYAAAVDAAGLPASSRWFLEHDPRRDRRPVREFVSFHPPQSEHEGVRKSAPVEEVSLLRASARRWKAAAAAALVLLLAGGAAAFMLVNRVAQRADVIESVWTPLRQARSLSVGQNLLAPAPGDHPPGAPMVGWRIRRSHRDAQSVTTAPSDTNEASGGTVSAFVLQSEAPDGEVVLESEPVVVEVGMKMTAYLELLPHHEEQTAPSVAMEVVLEDADGRPIRTLVHKEPGLRILRGLRSTRETFEITTPDARVRVRAILRGAGRAEGVRLSLERQAT